MKLLVDIGNTRIKWLLTEHATRIMAAEPQYAENLAVLLTAWQQLKKPEIIAIANVSNSDQATLLVKLAQQLWPDVDVRFAQTRAQAYGVTIAYKKPEYLGVDRWLALLALNRLHSLPAMVVDCGTALTIDVLAKGGVHQGGLIVPGLSLQQQSLQLGTYQLPQVDGYAQIRLGVSTQSGIANGTLMALVGLIEKVYQQLLSEADIKYTLILTGGDAQLLSQHLTVNAIVDATIVLQGLGILIDE